MTGHHEVQTFRIKLEELAQGYALPTGWKPFSVLHVPGERYALVTCRKWFRDAEASD